MRRTLSALLTLPLLALAPACDSEDSEVGDAFRNGQTLDVNIQIEMADGGDDEGTIIWEVLEFNAEIYEGPASEGNLGMYIENNDIYDSYGNKTCSIVAPYLNSNEREVIAANGGEVLFTVSDRFILEGEVDLKNSNYGQLQKAFDKQLLFTISGDTVFLGRDRDGYSLVRASADIEGSSDGRKLLIGALLTGNCGSKGLPGYTF